MAVVQQPMQPHHKRQKLQHAGHLHWFHWCVVILSLLLTIGAWYFSKEQLAQKILIQFEREADQTVELVKERMELYEHALWGGVAFIDANHGQINYAQWVDYANSLHVDTTYPGINGIGVIFNIKTDEEDDYLARENRQRPNFNIHPKHQQSELWPITYIIPVDKNKKAIGLDIAFETNRYNSVKKARDTGTAQMTGPIVLVQDDKKTPGFLFYAPFYQNGQKPNTVQSRQQQIIGVTYAPFIVEKLMQGTLDKQKRHVGIRISDADELLYDDGNNTTKSTFNKTVQVNLYGRQWTFDIWSNAEFNETSANSQPYFILFGGLIIDTLLLTLFILLTKANRLALSYADDMTAELKAKTVQLQSTNHDLEQFSYVASHDLRSPLRGINQLAQWIVEDIDDKTAINEHLKLMQSRVTRMENLLEDLLAYAKVGQLDEKHQIIDSRSLIQSQFELHPKADSFELQLIGDFPKFDTYPTSFIHVFRKLFSNAIKHHDKPQGLITISVTQTTQHYLFDVADNGPGIELKYHQKVFALFQTLKPRDEVEGSGMGLAIVQKIVTYHGGKIEVCSQRDEGACFIVHWPKFISLSERQSKRAS
jgi:signal transduction histidine kinase